MTDKKSILFIHGFPLDSSMWDEQREYFKKRYNFLAPDLAGFGERYKLGFSSIEDLAEDINSFLREIGRKKVVLCGFSMGGYIALAFYEKYPQFVEALVLADTRAEGDSEEGKKGRNQAIKEAETKGTEYFVENMPSKLLSENGLKNPVLLEKVKRIIARQRPQSIKKALVAMRDRKDRSFLLNNIEIPVLFICGEKDALTLPQEMKEMSLRVKNSSFEIIENSAHLSNIENSFKFNTVLDTFLESLEGKK